jgi:hypothetical protein
MGSQRPTNPLDAAPRCSYRRGDEEVKIIINRYLSAKSYKRGFLLYFKGGGIRPANSVECTLIRKILKLRA